MNEYKHIQMFNVHGNPEETQRKIQLFQDSGWDYIGTLNADHEPLMYALGWPSAKGEPNYPKGHEPKDLTT
ncbi:hypothetical protein PUS82_15535 [Cytobacillus firmus]|uniref:hypothetical protein n=1 Tax=Cytobacillus firmus TaxID=1399 RepID=UPI00237B9E70|nr:hypothetical protein [Cytobacillus firmus]MDD9312687.1 hypothetical protein [Cytobacillus firmus]